jgi:ubiquinone/menaquinone biosynthesis C-methylase UbiE
MADTSAAREIVDACPVCGSPDRAPCLPAADVIQCTSCDLLYVSPRPTAAAIAAFYSVPGRYARWDAQAGRAAMWRRRLERVRRLVPSGRLLDVGTGQGEFGAAASAHFDFEGTEISSEGARVARERYGLAIHDGDLLDLALPSDRYDVVTLWHVLEHVAQPRDVAVECHRLLRTGGVLAVAVPNADEDWQLTRRLWSDALQFARSQPSREDSRVPLVDHALYLMLGRMPLRRIAISRLDLARPGEEIHLAHFTLDTLAGTLKDAGFAIVERGLDDHSPDEGIRARIEHRRQLATYRLTGRAAANAIFVAARKVE